MAMYLAQATGSCIVTDSFFRWSEVRRAIRQQTGALHTGLAILAHNIESSIFVFPQDVADIAAFASSKSFAAYPALMRDAFKYLSNIENRGPKPNWEAHLNARFVKAHAPAQATIAKARVPAKRGRISCVFPPGCIQDNSVNRLLLMSSSERHLPNVPMAFFIEEKASRENEQ